MFIRDLLCYHILCDEVRLLFVPRNTQYDLRSNNSLVVPYHRVNYGINEPIKRSIILYNNLKDMDTSITIVKFLSYTNILTNFHTNYLLIFLTICKSITLDRLISHSCDYELKDAEKSSTGSISSMMHFSRKKNNIYH